MFTIRRLGDGATATIFADDSRQAVKASGLDIPGAMLLAGKGVLTVRYQIDSAGRARELSRYQADVHDIPPHVRRLLNS